MVVAGEVSRMRKPPTFYTRLVVLGVLMVNLGLCGCFTMAMWDHNPPKKIPTFTAIDTRRSHDIDVLILDDDRIAVLPTSQSGGPLDNLATLYRFQQADYAAMKPIITKAIIQEEIQLSMDQKAVKYGNMSFTFLLKDQQPITLQYIDTTLITRTGKEIHFSDDRIGFTRTVYAERDSILTTTDWSWLYKIPLTPLTLAADATATVIFMPVLVALMPAALLFSNGP